MSRGLCAPLFHLRESTKSGWQRAQSQVDREHKVRLTQSTKSGWQRAQRQVDREHNVRLTESTMSGWQRAQRQVDREHKVRLTESTKSGWQRAQIKSGLCLIVICSWGVSYYVTHFNFDISRLTVCVIKVPDFSPFALQPAVIEIKAAGIKAAGNLKCTEWSQNDLEHNSQKHSVFMHWTLTTETQIFVRFCFRSVMTTDGFNRLKYDASYKLTVINKLMEFDTTVINTVKHDY